MEIRGCFILKQPRCILPIFGIGDLIKGKLHIVYQATYCKTRELKLIYKEFLITFEYLIVILLLVRNQYHIF